MKTNVHTRLISALDALILALAGGLKLALLLALFGATTVEPRLPSDATVASEHARSDYTSV